MRERSEAVLADVVRSRAERTPDFGVVTFEHASLDGGATPDEVCSYAALAEAGNRIAAALVARGMQRGDRFALMMRNHPEFVETMIAASITGTVFVPIDPRTRRDKLAFQLRDAGCRGAICADYALPELLAARAEAPALEWVLALDSGEEPDAPRLGDVRGVLPLREALDTPAATVDVRLESADDPLQILFTSGTTGDPKGVVWPNARFGAFAGLGALLGYRSGERPYTGLSLTHGNAQAVTLGPALALGLRAVLSRRFTKSKLWSVCRLHGCTTFSMLGGMATAIYGEAPRPNDRQHDVRFVVSAGMPPTLWRAFEQRFGVAIFEWYGAVEGGLAMRPIGQGPIGSFGKPLPGLEMKILDDDDRECPPGVQGEICSRPAGGRAAVEYHGKPEASAAKTRGGWLRSGDIGHADADGWLFFDYRKGGGIRRSGEFVHPGFVEKVIAEHPAVTDVFVYGVPAASGAPGEKDVVAAIVPAPGVRWGSLVTASVFEHCRKALEPSCVPSWLQIVDEIPKTASEKPQERFLLDRFFAPGAPGVVREERA
ncbi:MAG: ATP-dependent acyl-CoA ligase [Proteobacteria bacterium]|nr:MAG: ATP-dependent acyl-CoA ligase [Pseudomonadota bacterium]